MTTVTTEQVQKDFASVRELIDRGETLVLEEDGVSIGTLYPTRPSTQQTKAKRVLGGLEGTMKVPDDFDEMMRDEIEEMFYGKP